MAHPNTAKKIGGGGRNTSIKTNFSFCKKKSSHTHSKTPSQPIYQEILSPPHFPQPGFTLIELIIVITILAILSTIAFVSFQSYTKDTRDTKRITELSQIEKGLEIYSIKNTPLPHPSEKYITVYSGSENNTILIQGELGDEIKSLLKVSGNPRNDDGLNYTYTTNANRTRYQLTAYLEKDPNVLSFNQILNPNQLTQKIQNIQNITSNIIPTTYATTTHTIDFTKRTPYTRGNYVSIFNNNHQPLQETELLSGNNTGSLNLTTPSNATTSYTLILGSDPTPVPALGVDIVHRVNDSITWSSGNAFTLNSTGTITKIIGGTNYTYNLKVVQMDDGTGHPTTAIWTTQNMRHPVNDCLTTDTDTWTNGTYSSCSVGNTTNGEIGYNDAPSDTLTNGLYYQWGVANQVCAPLGDGWHLPSDAEWFQLENASKTMGASCESMRYGGYDCDGAGWLGNKLAGIISTLGGTRDNVGVFNARDSYGDWWSSLENSTTAFYRNLDFRFTEIRRKNISKSYGYSVLCIKN